MRRRSWPRTRSRPCGTFYWSNRTMMNATASNPGRQPAGGRIPLWVKIAYSAFVAVLVPYYINAYGPTNFLYFCDVALLLGLVAVWTENALLASMPAVGILLPQAL